MAALLTRDNIWLAVLVAVVALSVLVVCRVEQGSAARALSIEHTGRHVRPAGAPREPHARPLVRHAAPRRALPAAPSAVETVPDAPQVSPFVPRKFA